MALCSKAAGIARPTGRGQAANPLRVWCVSSFGRAEPTTLPLRCLASAQRLAALLNFSRETVSPTAAKCRMTPVQQQVRHYRGCLGTVGACG